MAFSEGCDLKSSFTVIRSMRVEVHGRIVAVAAIVALGVNGDGRREVLGLSIGPSEAETFWTDFLPSLTRRGLRGVKW